MKLLYVTQWQLYQHIQHYFKLPITKASDGLTNSMEVTLPGFVRWIFAPQTRHWVYSFFSKVWSTNSCIVIHSWTFSIFGLNLMEKYDLTSSIGGTWTGKVLQPRHWLMVVVVLTLFICYVITFLRLFDPTHSLPPLQCKQVFGTTNKEKLLWM